jgi:murein L,D-transpeptidase YafK
LVTTNRILALLALLLFQVASADDIPKADKVLVDKSEKRLYLIKDGERFMSLPVTFGGEPKGHKVQQGDQRTPEGNYTLEWKNPNSKFYKSIRVSYPNADDRAKAEQLGVDPGGDIMVHGQANGWQWASPLLQFFSWTDGCVALSNKNMDKVWESVDPGTPIEIRP